MRLKTAQGSKDPADKNQFTKKKQTRLHNHHLNPSETTFLPRHFKSVAEKKQIEETDSVGYNGFIRLVAVTGLGINP